MKLRYRSTKSYKYQVMDDFEIELGEKIKVSDVVTIDHFLAFDNKGLLVIKKGYAWDGPSGPVRHSRNWMKGSLVHDALYQLLRNEKIGNNNDFDDVRKQADDIMYAILKDEGMSWFRRWYSHAAVRLFGKSSAKPQEDSRKIMTA